MTADPVVALIRNVPFFNFTRNSGSGSLSGHRRGALRGFVEFMGGDAVAPEGSIARLHGAEPQPSPAQEAAQAMERLKQRQTTSAA